MHSSFDHLNKTHQFPGNPASRIPSSTAAGRSPTRNFDELFVTLPHCSLQNRRCSAAIRGPGRFMPWFVTNVETRVKGGPFTLRLLKPSSERRRSLVNLVRPAVPSRDETTDEFIKPITVSMWWKVIIVIFFRFTMALKFYQGVTNVLTQQQMPRQGHYKPFPEHHGSTAWLRYVL